MEKDEQLCPLPEGDGSESVARAALESFKPMVFSVASSTPDTVCTQNIMDVLSRDPAFGGRLLLIDARAVPTNPPATTAGGAKTGKSIQPVAEIAGTNSASLVPADHHSAAFVRSEYERIAVELELARRRVVAARLAQQNSLYEQYCEDGMGEAEARRLAEEDMRDEDEDSDKDETDASEEENGTEAGAGATGPRSMPSFPAAALAGKRVEKPMFLCIRGYPSSVKDVGELCAAGVPLHVLLDVTSKVALSGSAAAERTAGGDQQQQQQQQRGHADNRAAATANAQGKRSGGPKSGAGAGAAVLSENADAGMSLPDHLRECQRRASLDRAASDPVTEVLVQRYEFPADPIVNAAPAADIKANAGATKYRLALPEKAAMLAIRDAVVSLEKRLYLFRALTSLRLAVPVPACDSLATEELQVNSAPLDGVGSAEDHAEDSETDSRTASVKRRSMAPRKSSPSVVVTSGTGAESPPATLSSTAESGPKSMAEVTARTVEYEDYMQRCTRFACAPYRSVAECFLAACVHQSSIAAASFPTREVVDDPEHADAVGESENAAVSDGADKVSRLPPSAEEKAVIDHVRQQRVATAFAESVFSGMRGRGSTEGKRDETPLAATLPNVRPPPHPAAGVAESLTSVPSHGRQGLEESLVAAQRQLFPSARDEVVAMQVQEVLSWSLGARRETPEAVVCAAAVEDLLSSKNANGWKAVTGSCAVGSEDEAKPIAFRMLSRGDGSPRTQQSVYAFASGTTFPLFVQFMDFCAAEHQHFYPPPPASDAEDETESESEPTDESSTDSDSDGDGESADGDVAGEQRERERGRRRQHSRVPTPPPPEPTDHFRCVQRDMRRRRTFEALKRFFLKPLTQELITAGPAASGVAEEVEWVFLRDGCTVETERTYGNGRQVCCALTTHQFPVHPHTCKMGYMVEPANESAGDADKPVLQDSIPAGVRAFLSLTGCVRLFTEVVADNSMAAEKATYARAVREARRQAAEQYDAMQSAGGRAKSTRGAGNRDKGNAAPQPTSAEMEDIAASAVPLVVERPTRPPEITVAAILDYEDDVSRAVGPRGCAALPARVSVRSSEGAMELQWAAPDGNGSLSAERGRACFVNLRVSVWRRSDSIASAGGSECPAEFEDTLVIRSIDRLTALPNGFVEVFSQDAKDYRVVLGACGTYVTVEKATGATVTVLPNGEKTLRRPASAPPAASEAGPAGPAGEQEERPLAKLLLGVVSTSDGIKVSVPRSDGASFTYDSVSQKLRDVRFGRGVSVEWARTAPVPETSSLTDTCVWRFGECAAGSPCATLCCCPSKDLLLLMARNGIAFAYRPRAQQITVRDPRRAAQLIAGIDLRKYRMELHALDRDVDSNMSSSWYAVDCAFGGLYGEVCQPLPHAATDSAGQDPRAVDVVRVSPLGCVSTEKVDGRAALPMGYGAADQTLPIAPLWRGLETVSSVFVSTVQRTQCGLGVESALHLCARPVPLFMPLQCSSIAVCGALAVIPDTVEIADRHRRVVQLQKLVVGARSAKDTIGPELMCIDVHAANAEVSSNATPSDGRHVVFADPGIASSLVRGWCQSASAVRLRERPTPPSVGLHATKDCVLTASADAQDQFPAHVFIGGQTEPSVDFLISYLDASTDGRVETDAPANDAAHLAVNQDSGQPHEQLSHANAPVDESAVPIARQHPAGCQTVFASSSPPAQASGRLNYWSSAIGPTADVLQREWSLSKQRTGAAERAADGTRAPADDIDAPPDVPAEPASAAKKLTRTAAAIAPQPTRRTGEPLMYSKRMTDSSVLPRTQEAERALPMLAVTTAASTPVDDESVPTVSFGAVVAGRCYETLFSVTNMSTVPCRYRVTVAKDSKPFLSVAHPHRFLAAGMTDAVAVTLSLLPSLDRRSSELMLAYEGCSTSIPVTWEQRDTDIVEANTQVPSSAATGTVTCLGAVRHPFLPGRTRRVRSTDEEEQDNARTAVSPSDSDEEMHGEAQQRLSSSPEEEEDDSYHAEPYAQMY